VAGGTGQRMKSDIPKQFLLLNNKPIIIHTIEKFIHANCTIVVVLPIHQMDRWNDLKAEYPILNSVKIAEGGNTRFESVKNGLNTIDDDGIVAIHDAVRPLISIKKIDELIDFAAKNSNAIAAISCIDTIRFELENKSYTIIDREKTWMMQTPQCFNINDLKASYLKAKHSNYTDDAAVYEDAGNKINLVEGEKLNIKITVAEDLKLAEFILQKD
jgi:2-C-methyl-D-erythritol 4-phosphate cytidylyltransferase